MTISASLLPEFDQEMAGARKTLERVPERIWTWKPHEKSFSAGDLASHLANVPSWGALTIEGDSFDVMPNGEPMKNPGAATPQEALASFDEGVKSARAALAGASDERLMGSWSLLSNGTTLFSMPRATVLRLFVMNHLVHHRAQLGLYLRLNDIPVPALYGPSADESGM